MKPPLSKTIPPLIVFALATLAVSAQVTVSLPGRSLDKLLPDYLRPLVYALNQANGTVPGTLLALNSANGAIVHEIAVNLNPTDMAMTPAGDALYVINAGSRTISKVDLTTFTVVGEKPISTPNSYNLSNPLYLVAGPSGKLYYTDGAWGPEIYSFDFNGTTTLLVLNTGGNQDTGAGGIVLNRSGTSLYAWRQYGWGAGNVNSWVTHYHTAPTARSLRWRIPSPPGAGTRLTHPSFSMRPSAGSLTNNRCSPPRTSRSW